MLAYGRTIPEVPRAVRESLPGSAKAAIPRGGFGDSIIQNRKRAHLQLGKLTNPD
jgi:hypothetical protein